MTYSDRLLTLTITYHPDTTRIGESASLGAVTEDMTFNIGRLAPEFSQRRETPRGLEDSFVSRSGLSARVSDDSLIIARNESPIECWVEGKFVSETRTVPLWQLERGVQIQLSDRILLIAHFTSPEIGRGASRGLIGCSDTIHMARTQAGMAASDDTPVLLVGEPGVGKSLLARAIHTASARGGGPLVQIDLTAFEQGEMLNELFAPHGAFNRADGGSLLIEGIDEAPLSVQGPLVSAIKDGTLDNPLTGDFGRVDVRLIFAVGTNLSHAVEEGYVLEALQDSLPDPILLAPLRHRPEDVAPIFINFLTQELRAVGNETVLQQGTLGKPLWLSPDFIGRLTRYYWPGNVDQIVALAEAVAQSSHEGLSLRITEPVAAMLSNATAYVNDLGLSAPAAAHVRPEDVDEMNMVGALRAYRWCATATANHLGISRRALFELMDASSAIRPSSGLNEAAVRGQYRQLGGNLALLCERLEVSRRTLKRQLNVWGRLTAPDVPFDLMGI